MCWVKYGLRTSLNFWSKVAITSLIFGVMAFWAAKIVILPVEDCRAWVSCECDAYWREATFELGILSEVAGLHGACEENADFVFRFQA